MSSIMLEDIPVNPTVEMAACLLMEWGEEGPPGMKLATSPSGAQAGGGNVLPNTIYHFYLKGTKVHLRFIGSEAKKYPGKRL